MNKSMQNYYIKLYIIGALSVLILGGLLYLLLAGDSERLKENLSNKEKKEETSEVVEVEEEKETTSKEEEEANAAEAEAKAKEEAEKKAEEEAKEEEEEKKKEEEAKAKEEEEKKKAEEEAKAKEEEGKKKEEESSIPPLEERQKADVTSNDSVLKIVNPEHLIVWDYVPEDLVYVNATSGGEQRLRKEAAKALEDMFAAAKKDGIDLFLISGYRSYGEQQYIYDQYAMQYGHEALVMSDTIPGGTEHQLGLSVDIGQASRACELNNCFEETDAYTWLIENAPKYGYIERHPAGKEEYTRIVHNPWSFRYVGKEVAENISASGMAMEEYYGF